jgi:hypothetical protein
VKWFVLTLAVLVLAAGFVGKASAERQPHVNFRTPRGAIHCFITTFNDPDGNPNAFTGLADCSTRTLKSRHLTIFISEKSRSHVYSDEISIINMNGGTTLRAGRTYKFKYPWRTGRTMFWVTVRRTPTMESLHVRNPEGHGFLLRVGIGSCRTTLVRW